MSFADKVVVITGSSSGIGAAAAVSFAQKGANVVIVGRNQQKLQRVKDECSQSGNELLSINADITNEEDAKRIIKETVEKFGKIDVLINNAGVGRIDSILSDNLLTVYDFIMNINLRAQIHMTNLAAPYLIKTKGNVINISSIAAKSPKKHMIIYAISKAALDHFTRVVASELAPHGVRVNTISPGPVKTDIFEASGIDISMEEISKIVPLGRVSESNEIAELILFIAGDKAKAITGSDYITDNGCLLAN